MPNLAQWTDPRLVTQKPDAVWMTVISVSNPKQQGKNFQGFLQLVNQAFQQGSIRQLIIVTTGYLQRHYFSLGLAEPLSEAALEQKAQQLDQQWLDQHQPWLEQLKVPVAIKRWQEVLNSEPRQAFDDFAGQLKQRYQTHTRFRKYVDQHAEHYVQRKMEAYVANGTQRVSVEEFKRVALDYILEELAAYVQLKQCGADLFTYPGAMNVPAQHMIKYLFKGNSLPYVPYQLVEQPVRPSPLAVGLFQATSSPNRLPLPETTAVNNQVYRRSA